jgi:hypothetical protein
VRTVVQPIEVEGGRGTPATCARTARRHSEPGILASPRHRWSAWSRQHEHREEGVAVSSGAQAIGFLLTTRAILPNLPTWRHPTGGEEQAEEAAGEAWPSSRRKGHLADYPCHLLAR